mmetsp:Transcript_26432/g.48375  ORF Transcript_26432/g.48375 Transcript_26432/m.48375 type:complete len:302 (-) Transcript_26432:983-1888(-)
MLGCKLCFWVVRGGTELDCQFCVLGGKVTFGTALDAANDAKVPPLTAFWPFVTVSDAGCSSLVVIGTSEPGDLVLGPWLEERHLHASVSVIALSAGGELEELELQVVEAVVEAEPDVADALPSACWSHGTCPTWVTSLLWVDTIDTGPVIESDLTIVRAGGTLAGLLATTVLFSIAVVLGIASCIGAIWTVEEVNEAGAELIIRRDRIGGVHRALSEPGSLGNMLTTLATFCLTFSCSSSSGLASSSQSVCQVCTFSWRWNAVSFQQGRTLKSTEWNGAITNSMKPICDKGRLTLSRSFII